MYIIKYKASKQAHFKRHMLFLWHKENSNDDYTSSVEAFMNTMQIVWHKCKDKASNSDK